MNVAWMCQWYLKYWIYLFFSCVYTISHDLLRHRLAQVVYLMQALTNYWCYLIQFNSIWFENRWLALLETLIRYNQRTFINAITDKLLLLYRIGSCFVIDSLSSCFLYRNVTAPFYRNKVQRPGRWGSNAWSLFRCDEIQKRDEWRREKKRA